MLFRIVRSSSADAEEQGLSMLGGVRPIIIPLVTPGSATGRALLSRNDSVVLDLSLEELGVDVWYADSEDDYRGFVEAAFALFGGLYGEVPTNGLLCLPDDRRAVWILSGADATDPVAFQEDLRAIGIRLNQGKKPASLFRDVKEVVLGTAEVTAFLVSLGIGTG